MPTTEEGCFGALEAGGTKMVLGIFSDAGGLLDTARVPTGTPEDTMPAMIAYFRRFPLRALGIAAFGPLDLDTSSPTYGFITHTPKLMWKQFPLLKTFADALDVPCALDTDVGGAALAEGELGAGRGLESTLYVTVGTGIGGGLYTQGRVLHGLIHPEWGHILLAPRGDDPAPRGFCPYHEHCLEGLASGPAMEKRWGVPAAQLTPDHPAWDLEAYYLAQMCHNALMTVSPSRIVLGGGVMNAPGLMERVRAQLPGMLGGYLNSDRLAHMDAYVTAPGLGALSGLTGAYLLARRAIDQESRSVQ